jgi:hypothetical protein
MESVQFQHVGLCVCNCVCYEICLPHYRNKVIDNTVQSGADEKI